MPATVYTINNNLLDDKKKFEKHKAMRKQNKK